VPLTWCSSDFCALRQPVPIKEETKQEAAAQVAAPTPVVTNATKLFIGQVPEFTAEEVVRSFVLRQVPKPTRHSLLFQIRPLFEPYGTVLLCNVLKPSNTGVWKGAAFAHHTFSKPALVLFRLRVRWLRNDSGVRSCN
jgi:hypothetical protein